MKPSDAFNVEDENDVAGIASILRLVGYEDDAIEQCLAQLTKEHTDDITKNRNSPKNNVSSSTHVSQTQYESDLHDEMALPIQFDTPNCVKGAKDLGVQIDFQNEDVSLSMPSLPPLPTSEVIHYYAETTDWDASNLEHIAD